MEILNLNNAKNVQKCVNFAFPRKLALHSFNFYYLVNQLKYYQNC